MIYEVYILRLNNRSPRGRDNFTEQVAKAWTEWAESYNLHIFVMWWQCFPPWQQKVVNHFHMSMVYISKCTSRFARLDCVTSNEMLLFFPQTSEVLFIPGVLLPLVSFIPVSESTHNRTSSLHSFMRGNVFSERHDMKLYRWAQKFLGASLWC